MGSCQSDPQPIKVDLKDEKVQIIKRAKFEHPQQIIESVSAVSSYSSQRNSSPSISPFRTACQINTQEWSETKQNIKINNTKRILTSLNFNSLSPLRKESKHGNMSNLSVELVEDTAVKLQIPSYYKRSRRRVTTKVDLLNKVKQMKYSEKLKRKRT